MKIIDIRPELGGGNVIARFDVHLDEHLRMSMVPGKRPARRLPYEVSRLLDGSIDTIRDMREQTGIAGIHGVKDVLIDLRVASERARDLSAADIRDALVDAADVIRTLKIVLDGKDEL